MPNPKFDPAELEIVARRPASPHMPAINLFKTPVTDRAAYAAALRREPCWQLIGVESRIFTPRLLPDNVARAFVLENTPFDPNNGGGKDMFGMEWEYVPVAGGSMIRPGEPFMDDACQWPDKIVWPDIDSWDWAGSARENNDTYLATDAFNVVWFQTGWYERLITFMDFEGAVMALIDEDQKEAVHDFFDRLTTLYIRIFDKFMLHFPQVDSFYIHDDWGSQKETFFSPATAAEMIVPYMRRVTEHLHAKGKFCELHSCGQLIKQVPNMIAAGWDSWGGQAMNDTQKIYDLYGDKIMVGVIPDHFDPAATSQEEQRERARQYAERFCRPDKPSLFNHYGAYMLTPAFREELYKQSRILYGG